LTGDYIQVFTTTASKQEANEIALHLVEQKLAACVQVVGPISSTYRWKEKIENAEEWLCIIKTSVVLFEKLKKAIGIVQKYEVPEVTAVPIIAMNIDYEEWLRGTLVEPPEGGQGTEA
jgi:periplasmic divalent cation tolerance protein